ncbi:aminopeptidase P family N-terminal domain-containing protein [Allofournierella sp.]|uniref:aminopeptidase P family N-terminal domain-containing protein n=1 Tax=Allofournierella sp. TaxID=1940256 RepID=UPI002E7A1D84|nr:aminopeptidase P family N-terminal domain-containing protein [Fournierella sp.]MEE0757894.1 aminopeptidase P family N-terminal domain-containing protein [Fournierella sp.]
MLSTNEKIALLRAAMKAAGANACLIPSSDPHISEYLPAHWSARRYFSGFTGSVGNLVVTETASALWVDGRYFVQAAHQLEGSEIVLQKMGVEGVPTLLEYLTDALGEGQVLAVDGMVTATSTMKELQAALAKKGASVKSVDLVEGNWPDRPAVPASEAFLLDEVYAGRSTADKLADLRAELAKQEAGAMVVCRLDSVAWLLNLRANDLDNTPFALAYCFVTPDDAILFINTARLPAEAVEALGRQGVRVTDYDHLLGALTGYHHDQTVLVDEAGTNWAVYSALKGNPVFTLKAGEDPIQALKAVKNPVEIENLKKVHVKDGVAMVKFQMWLEEKMAAGEAVTEVDVDEKLMALRGEQALNIGVSFDTIAAYGANAAMMHYHATPGNCTTLAPKGFLLVDCGGQYLDGTTDITRTYTLGELTDNERTYYTYVLKSHIDMAKLQFLNTCTGGNLDVIARAPVWAHGIDYRCGTGHGVGFVGGVHEGPQNLRITNHTVFKPGMIVTDEPGIYEEGEVGIRIENELLCCARVKNQYGQFLGFEPITYCPIDLTPVRPELLDADEKEWLNAFHQMVREKLTPHLSAAEAAWLAEKTKPLA